jgi:hypothetical protein
MSWTTAAQELGRRPCTIVEIDLDYCQLTYGVGACTAVLGVSSVNKCYNTARTCAVPLNYDPAAKTYRFSDRELGPLVPSIPCLKHVAFTSGKLDPGKSMGIRSSATITLQDLPWPDLDSDKYVHERAYTPDAQGTYFGKWLARNPYYQNREVRILSGFMDEDGSVDISKFQTRTYVMDKVSGPTSQRVVTIHVMDVLRLIDNDKAQIPATSSGTLAAALTNVGTTVNLLPSGIGNLEYPATGRAAIDAEIVNFSRVGDVVTLNLRGALFTDAVDHEIGATFQLCKVYDDVPLVDVVYELVVTIGQIPAAYVDLAQWQDEASTWLSGHRLNATIATPTGAMTLLNELSSTCLFYIWWADYLALIPFRAIRPEDPAINSRRLNDDYNFIADSLSITESPEQRISQVWVHFARRNPLLKLEELRNYQIIPVYLDTDAQSVNQYSEKRVRRILCRFFGLANESQAVVLGARMLARYRDNPRTFKFTVDAKDADMQLADVVEVTTASLQGPDGAAITTNMQIISRMETVPGDKYTYEATDTFFSGRYAFVLATGTADYPAATLAARNKGAFVCVTATNKMPNGDAPYKII